MTGTQFQSLGCWRYWTEVKSLGRNVDQRRPQLHGALPIGDRVVQLGDQCCPTTGQAFQQRHLPQRPIAVEVSHPLAAALVQNVLPGGAFRHEKTAQVEAEVKVRIHDQSWVGDTNGSFDQALAQDWHHPAGSVVTINKPFPVRRLLQHQATDHRRSHHGILAGRKPRGVIPTRKALKLRHCGTPRVGIYWRPYRHGSPQRPTLTAIRNGRSLLPPEEALSAWQPI